MINYFRPYEGDKPYIFVSYAHKNSEKVLEIINKLRAQNYLIWYDEGIPAGSDWPRNIADHMKGCDTVIMFDSQEFLDSNNCRMEALEAEKQGKHIYRFDLNSKDDSFPVLPDSLKGTEEDYTVNSRIKKHFNWWIPGLGLAVILIIASVFVSKRITGGRTLAEIRQQQESSVEVVVSDEADTSSLGSILDKNADFKDNLSERYVRLKLNADEGDISVKRLLELEEFMVCGNLIVNDPNQTEYSADGVLKYEGFVVLRGQIEDLSLQSYMLNLKRLVLSCQKITDISALSALTQLEYLDLSDNEISDTSALEAMNNLCELHLEHTKVDSLNNLKNLKNLKYVYVSTDMLPIQNETDISIKVVW